MNDGLGYIREALREGGRTAPVKVIRYERDPRTGYFNIPFTVEALAGTALKNLELPMNKRSRVWKYIRPVGMTMDGNMLNTSNENKLNSPDLIQSLMDKIDSLEKQLSEKPKRAKKQSSDIVLEITDTETDLLEA
jgi:hypothetical protein